MLKGIPPLLSPELLHTIAAMGHGDEIVLADGNYPSASHADRLVRADGLGVLPVLQAILQLFPVDTFVAEQALVMQPVDEDAAEPPIWKDFRRSLQMAEGRRVELTEIDRFAFYERSREAYAIVATSETALYANIILKKGIVPPA
ncbi:MAG: fucose isomerase [Planctomycetaceae bacterium]|nr:fucose isomerase [Planctomycetaceae bacterium]